MNKSEYPEMRIYAPNIKHCGIAEVKQASTLQKLEQKLVCYKKALLTPTNHLFINGKNIPSGFITGYNKKKLSFLTQIYLFIKFRFVVKPQYHNGTYLWAYDVWSKNYYHWFCEALPRLVKLHKQNPEAVIILPLDFQEPAYIKESLERLQLRYIWIDQEKQGHIFENLATVFMPVLFAEINPCFQQEMKDAIVSAVALRYENPVRKIYVSRSKARYRKIVNEEELLPVLLSYGYEIIHTETLSFNEQVHLFAQAKFLVTTHGAALTNSMFMQPGSSVMEIRNNDWSSQPFCFWQLANIFDLKWEYLLATPVEKISNFNDVFIDREVFHAALRAFEGESD